MYESDTDHLESSPTPPRLAPQGEGLAAAPDHRRPGRQRRRRQSVDEACPRGRTRGAAPPSAARGPSPALRRATRPGTGPVAARARSVWLTGPALDARPDRRRDPPGSWRLLPPTPWWPPLPNGAAWGGGPDPSPPPIREFLAKGAAQRLHLERLPAYAPELNPGEGLWAQLKGVERRHLCGGNLPHRKRELRDAVKRVRRKLRSIRGFFRGAGL
jgi:hypothetical protein